MYQALYRKYRPKTFEDVVGQEHITTTLKNEIKNNKIGHAYIFTGSRGTGKTTCSKILAKAVNCLNHVDGNPCGECEICKGIEDGSILDVVEMDAASNNGVDNIRELREEAYFLPARAKYRVYIIDEMHMLSAGAFNALLKILEEPPAHVVFILATTEVHKVAATIMSRCQRFDFRRIDTPTIAKRLKFVAGEENVSLTDDAAMLIAHLSQGGMRDALSLLDLCMSSGEEITADLVKLSSGVSGDNSVENLVCAIRDRDMTAALKAVDEAYNLSVDMQRLCVDLMEFFRDILVCQLTNNPEKILSRMPDQVALVKEHQKDFSSAKLVRLVSLLTVTATRISQTSYKKAEFEMAVIRMINESLDTSNESLVQRITQLETALKHGQFETAVKNETPLKPVSKAEETQTQETKIEEPKSQSPQPESVSTSDKPYENWGEILEKLSSLNLPLASALRSSNMYLTEKYALIDTQNTFFLELIRKNEDAKKALKQAIFEVTGKVYGIGPYKTAKKKDEMADLNAFEDKLKKLNINYTEK